MRRLILCLCSLFAIAVPGVAQQPVDNIKGRALNFPTFQLRPMALSADGARLYAVNQPGSRLALFDVPGLTKTGEIPVGPGLVSVVERIPGEEVWLVDSIQHSITVVNPTTLAIVRTIRVGAEPHGLVFTPSRDRAYVSCSAANRIDVIDAVAKTVVKSIPVPAMGPRAMTWANGRVWFSPLRSGNNTAPAGRNSGVGVDDIVRVQDLAEFPNLQQLPDRDLFSIAPQPDPAADALHANVVSGIGTLLLDMAPRPGASELWITNTEALNAVHRGERAFVEGQVVSNRVTIVDLTGGQKHIVDLDALAPAGAECAQPTGIAFSPDGARAFVVGYGSDRVAVLDVAGTGQVTWAGHIDVPPLGLYPEGAGTRSVLVTPDGQTLYVFSKIDNALVGVPLASLPDQTPFAVTSPTPSSIGFKAVSLEEIRGRFLFSNAKFSKSGTTSCASCHIDGTTDGIVWDLSGFLDPEGTPNDALRFGTDVKGPLMTQVTQRLAETAPYHWRGEKSKLRDFNDAFINLMENEVGGQPAHIGGDFEYISRYLRNLAIPANPRQELDRSLTLAQATGADIFERPGTFQGFACVDCHTLPIGTSGELLGFKTGGLSKSGVVPHLRGVGDKLSPPHTIGGKFGTRTETGGGLLHGGSASGLLAMLEMTDPLNPGQPVFNLTGSEARDLAAYLDTFDTGLAPATTFQVTAHAGNWNGEALAQIDYLLAEAVKGNCDVIVRCSPTPSPQGPVMRSLLYRPAQDKFQSARRGAQLLTKQTLLAEAATGSPVTFLGVPLLSGLPMALDRDMDGLWDLDELALGTDFENFDTDGDGYPDGYEIFWGLDPLVFDTTSPDTGAPSVVGTPQVIYRTQTAIKFEFQTDEMVRVVVIQDGLPVQRAPFGQAYDTLFSLVLHELQAGRSYNIDLQLIDPSGNERTVSYTMSTAPAVLPAPVFVASIQAVALPSGTSASVLRVAVELVAGSVPALPGHVVRASVYHQRASNGHLTMVAPLVSATVGSHNGLAYFQIPLPSTTTLGGPGTLFTVVQDVLPVAGSPGYVEALDQAGPAETAY